MNCEQSKCYVRVVGGLGNQLFQIANGFSYSKKYQKKLIIDDTEWNASQGNHVSAYMTNLLKNFEHGRFQISENVTNICETSNNYSELPFSPGDVILNGYFQSLKYFKDFKHEFISNLSFPDIDASFLGETNMAFHIRRGDYKHYIYRYGDLTNYFSRLFERFQNEYQINVFTDSPNEVLQIYDKYKFNLIQTSSEINDLILMSLHDNMVCSNSSFSWWASVLGKEKKQIIVPDRWLMDKNCEDIYNDNMTRIPI